MDTLAELLDIPEFFDGYSNDTATYFNDEDPPMNVEIRPLGLNYAVGVTGGRFADWLERAGEQADIDYARDGQRRQQLATAAEQRPLIKNH